MFHNRRNVRQCTLALAVSILLATPLAARALDFEFIKIADTSTTVPGAGGIFTSFSAPAINGYTVAFNGNKSGYTGIFTSSGGTLTRAVDTTSLVPGAGTPFTSFSGFSLDSNQIAFTGVGSGTQGVYLTNPTGLTKVVDLTTAIPNGTGNFTAFSAPSLSSGNIAFVGAGAGQQGVYSTSNGLHVVADTQTAIPSGTGNFAAGTFASPSINYSDVAFVAGGSGSQQGIYDTTGNNLHKIADKNSPLPGGGGNFSGFTNVSLTYGTDAFANGNPTPLGIYNNSGGNLNLVANATTAVPGGTGNFTSFGTPSSWGGDSTFTGGGSGGQSGLYTTWGGSLTTVIDNSSILDGKTVVAITSGNAQTVNNGTFVFHATFTDGSSGLYVAQQNYNWAANTSGTWDSPANWSFGVKPRTILYTNIHPDSGATVTGPATATTIRGLDINSQFGNGVAELRLQPGVPLSVTESTSVGSNGRLSINGSSLYSNYGVYNYGGYVDLGGGQLSGGNLNNYNNGTVAASGTIGAHVENNAFLQVLNTSARFANSINNYQEFQIINSQVEIDQDFDNIENGEANQHGRVDVRNSILQFSTQFDNTGLFNVSFGTTDIFGVVNNDSNGQIILSGNSNTTFYDHLIHNGNTFRISSGSTAVFFGLVTGAGAFTGGGNKIFEGGYSPGNSPASVSLEGPVTFAATNSLNIELGGPNPGTGFDQVHVSGQLALDGSLKVSLINGYVPNVGATFNVLDWTSSTGSFAATPLATQQGILKLFWNTAQTPTNINLTLTRAYYDIQSGNYPQALSGAGVEVIKSTPAAATLSGAYTATGPLTVSAGHLAFSATAGARQSPAVLLQTAAVSLAAGTILDLSNHDLLIHGGNAATVESLIGSAYFFGLWNKPGITSSSAQTNPITTLGIMSGADYNTYSTTPGVFDGAPVANTDIVVKYTYSGDINLDGLVNDDDFGLFSGAYFFTGVGNYALGDLNFDGLVNDDDFGVFSGNYFFTPASPLGSEIAPGGSAPVPEPASMFALGLGSASLLLRRSRRTS